MLAFSEHRLRQPPGESALPVVKIWCATAVEHQKSIPLELERGYQTYDIQLAAAIMDRHIPSPAIICTSTKQLAHELCQSESALLEHAGLAILSEYHI